MKQENERAAEVAQWPGYWREKKPCWVLVGCPASARERCDAFLHPEIPCWEHRATLCEEVLRVSKNCQHCIVYKSYRYVDESDPSAFLE